MRFLTLAVTFLLSLGGTRAQSLGSCYIPRGNPVMIGCNNVYQAPSDCWAQCGTNANQCSDLFPLIPIEGVGSCGINQGQNMYYGCFKIFEFLLDAQRECPQGQPYPIAPFIPTTQDTMKSCYIPRGNPVYVGSCQHPGLGFPQYIYQTLSECSAADTCGAGCPPIPFIPASGTLSTGAGSCGIAFSMNVYPCNQNVYQSYQNAVDSSPACSNLGFSGGRPFIPTALNTQSSCALATDSPVYGGCFKVYQSLSDCQTQCGANLCNTLKFKPASGDSATGFGSCGITNGAHVWVGCGNVYQASANAQQDCGSRVPTPSVFEQPFIPTNP